MEIIIINRRSLTLIRFSEKNPRVIPKIDETLFSYAVLSKTKIAEQRGNLSKS